MQFLVNTFVSILNAIHSVVGSYGVAIIVMTFFVRILLLPLTLKQEKSMKRMRDLEPKINQIKEKYKDDKGTLNQKIAELYQTEKVNPAAGCLPLLIQLPIFIALYRAFIGNSIPQETFLWFSLSEPDNLFNIGGFAINLLPILTAILSLIQTKLMTPQQKSGDKDAVSSSMQNALLFMPIMMLFVFYRLNAALNLYYLVNTALSILQQYYVMSKREG